MFVIEDSIARQRPASERQTMSPQRRADEDEIEKAEEETKPEYRNRHATEEEILQAESAGQQRRAPEDKIRRVEYVTEQRPADEEEIRRAEREDSPDTKERQRPATEEEIEQAEREEQDK
jgi:hypothetical protein